MIKSEHSAGSSDEPLQATADRSRQSTEASETSDDARNPFQLTRSQLEAIADQIFQNEAGGDRNKLFFWSPNEDFPSLGIGHFIWFPRNAAAARARFGGDSFPDLVRFLQSEGEELPSVIKETLPELHCPWATRSAFQSVSSATRESVIAFLERTKAAQMRHILNRFHQASKQFATGDKGPELTRRIEAVSKSPTGPYPLIDYVNFKGEGTSQSSGGWGLWQVLMDMEGGTDPERAHHSFAAAADRVLTRRTKNNPSDKVFLAGWRNRIKTYRTFRM